MIETTQQNQLNPPFIFNRKEYFTELALKKTERHINGVTRRQMILLSQNADTLLDSELLSHHKELRFRRIISPISFFILPVALYLRKFSTHAIVYSLIPSYYIAKNMYHCSLLSRNCDLSLEFALKSKMRFSKKILNFNGKRLADAGDKWPALNPHYNDNNLSVKDWIARNEYS
jgi:hypothetical protein